MGTQTKRCPLRDECSIHGQHGGEAEKLRKGIELLFEAHEDHVPRLALIRLLDGIDARDSLAYLEACDPDPAESTASVQLTTVEIVTLSFALGAAQSAFPAEVIRQLLSKLNDARNELP